MESGGGMLIRLERGIVATLRPGCDAAGTMMVETKDGASL